jgi:hypothetical protein
LTEQFFHTEFPLGIDFALVDGDHKYNGCYSDLSIVYKYLNIGGIIAIDDYKSGPPNGASLPEVTSAIDNFCYYNNIIHQEWYKDGKGFAIICKE